MNKILSLLFMAGILVFASSCGGDDEPEPEKTVEELQAEAIATAQAAVDAKATSDASATGATDDSVFDDWT
ncbi:MAG: hypothetical protein RIE59_16190, partial [Imperialibacter sp.]